jgi:hypothetical protein
MPQLISAPQESIFQGGLRGAVGYAVEVLGYEPSPEEGPYPDDANFGPDPKDPEGRWKSDYVLEGFACDAIDIVDSSCAENVRERPKPDGKSSLWITQEGRPFALHASVKCSTFQNGFLSEDMLDGFKALSRRRLFSCQWAQIANELWTGEAAQLFGYTSNRWLTKAGATVDLTPGGEGVAPIEAIASIEEALVHCSCGVPNVIHVPMKMIPYLADSGQLRQRGNRFFTWNNSIVVADPGYPGTGIGGVDPLPGEWWIYGTGPLAARLGEVVTPEQSNADALTFPTNDFQVRSERMAAISWTCCSFGIKVKEC